MSRDHTATMAKSRHKKAENVRKCFRPCPEAIAEVTSLLAPGDRSPPARFLISAVAG